MGLAAIMYTQDYDETYPPISSSTPSAYSFPDTRYWLYGLIMQNGSSAKLITSEGLIYPYLKNKDINRCLSAQDLVLYPGGAPFTIDSTDAPLGYAQNVLVGAGIVRSYNPTTYYGPFTALSDWDTPADSVLMTDGGGNNSAITCWPPRSINNNSVNTLNLLSGRHPGYASNVVFQDGHAKVMRLNTTGLSASAKKQKVGNLIGPNVTSPTAIGSNYYFVPVKNTSNYAF